MSVVISPMQLKEHFRLVRLKPFDQSTELGRGDERQRRIVLSAGASALSKCISLLATLISIPLALRYLGVERFGVWSTLSSLVLTLQFVDLGIGNGIVNTVSAAYGRHDGAAIKRYISSGMFALLSIALVVMILGGLSLSSLSWVDFFKIRSTGSDREVDSAVAVFIVCMALGIPLAIVQRVQIALQKSFIASLWQCLANLLGLFAIWFATYLQLGLPWLVAALLGAPLFAAFANSLLFFYRTAPAFRPAPSSITGEATSAVMKTGLSFFVIQVAVAIVFASDSIVITKELGVSSVASYAIPERLFSIMTLILSTLLTPLWPAYSEAIARGDVDWVKRILRKSVTFSALVSIPGSVFLLFCGPFLIGLWTGRSVDVAPSVMIGLAIWKPLESIGMALGMFLNGAGVIRFQVLSCCIMSVSAILLKPYMVRHLGISGAPLSTALIYAMASLIPIAVLLPRLLRGIEARKND